MGRERASRPLLSELFFLNMFQTSKLFLAHTTLQNAPPEPSYHSSTHTRHHAHRQW